MVLGPGSTELPIATLAYKAVCRLRATPRPASHQVKTVALLHGYACNCDIEVLSLQLLSVLHEIKFAEKREPVHTDFRGRILPGLRLETSTSCPDALGLTNPLDEVPQ